MTHPHLFWEHGSRLHLAADGKGIALWAIQALLAIICLVIGVSSLLNVDAVRGVFADISIGPAPRYVTGFAMTLAALLLVLSRGTSCLGALLAMYVMAGVIIVQLVYTGGNPAWALVVLILGAVVAWERRPDFWAAEKRG